MITSGITFQPGADRGYNPGGGTQPNAPSNPVQDAIKVLSLRLPKVVGAQGIAPSPLLTSQGSGGSRVDSVVNQVLMRLFGEGGGQPQPAAPSPSLPTAPPSMPDAPTFSGSAHGGIRPVREAPSIDSAGLFRPRIIVDTPDTGAEGRRAPFGGGSLPGTDANQPPGAFAPAPMWPPSFSLPDKPEPVFEI